MAENRDMILVSIVEDVGEVRDGLATLIEGADDCSCVGLYRSVEDILEDIGTNRPDVVLMDIGLPDMSGIDAARELKRLRPSVAIVALTIHEDAEYFFKMLDAGATGYVPKRAAPEELLSAIEAAARGEVYLYPSMAKLLVGDYLRQEQAVKSARALDGLTAREQEVLTPLVEGESNQAIADQLGISPKTVARPRENLMRKLNLHSRAELVKYAIRKGIIQA